MTDTFEVIRKSMFIPKKGQRVMFIKNGVHVGCQISSLDGLKSMLIGFYPKGGLKALSTIKDVFGCAKDAELWIPDPLLLQEGTKPLDYITWFDERQARIFKNLLCDVWQGGIKCSTESECTFMESSSGTNPNRITCRTPHIKYSLVGLNCRSFLVSVFGKKLEDAISKEDKEEYGLKL